MLNNNYVVYDIEVLPNVFTCAILDVSGDMKVYEISPRRNDIHKLRSRLGRLADNKTYMVGFNNVGYDYPVIHYLLTDLHGVHNGKLLTESLYQRSQNIITSTDKFAHTMWDNQCIIPQVDLYKIHHFDNQARRTSLKRLQFNMRSPSVQEFELDFNKKVKRSSDIRKLVEYNKHDVIKTHEFAIASKEAIAFRQELSNSGRYLLNFNDTRIGKDHFVTKLKEELGDGIIHDEDAYGRRIKRQTPRDIIRVADIIIPCIKFRRREFRDVHDKIVGMYAFPMDGKIHWNENKDYRQVHEATVRNEERLKAQKKTLDYRRYDEIKTKLDKVKARYSDRHITCDADGLEFVFGKGGLHGSLNNTVVRSGKRRVIIDLDVTSYYPSIAIAHDIYPEHLSPLFVKIYEGLKKERTSHPKGTAPNAMLKLALNGVYGDSNNKFSPFYDPQYTMSITVNGQLMLLMLWEWLSSIDGCKIIQANTDGITIIVDRNRIGEVGTICRRWQKRTGMQLESAYYDAMWIRDGNNYIAQYKGGELKCKGAYNYHSLYHDREMGTSKIEWHKDHSMLVTKKAAEAHLVHGIDIEEFIMNHDDIYDFFLTTNINRASRLMWGGEVVKPKPLTKTKRKKMTADEILEYERNQPDFPELRGELEEMQRNTRYIVSENGRPFTKIMKPLKGKTNERYIAVNKGQLVTPHNVVESEDVSDYDIDYDFYIAETKKLTEVFE